jgi:cell wall-associated NlpC family hydrolase
MLMFGICNLSIVPVRAEPSDKSEMVSQLLLGEHFTILETQAKWVKIQNAWDNYEGWISNKQFDSLNQAQFEELNIESPKMVADIAHVIVHQNTKETMAVVMGSVLPHFSKHAFFLGKEAYKYEGSLQSLAPKNLRHAIIETAFLYLNSPYLWGGKSPFGIDCSGFSQMVYKLCGVKILRDASQQALQGSPLSFIEEALPGDLAFFDNEDGKIIHVGIVLKGNKIIHASGSVRIDKLDHQGIYNETTKNYTHNLRVIKNVID